MKEKSAMEDIFFDFAKTKDALGQLSTDLIELEGVITNKQRELEKIDIDNKKVIAEKEKIIADLRVTTQKTLDEVESINKYIAGVL